jgi:DNA polymerase III alpha subunit
MAITDHGYCIGALEVYDKAKKAGLVGIPGCEFYLIPDADYKFSGKAYDYYHVTVWAVTEKGYRNLLKLGSIAFGEDLVVSTKSVKEDGVFRNKTDEFSRVVKNNIRRAPDAPRRTSSWQRLPDWKSI